MHYLVSRVRVSMAAPVAHERVIYSAMGPTLDSPWVIRPAFEKRVSYKKPWNFISRVIIFGVALISRIFMVFGAGRIRVNGGDAFLNLLRTTRYKQGLITVSNHLSVYSRFGGVIYQLILLVSMILLFGLFFL